MKILYLTLIVLFTIVSCKSPEAREPISKASGSFIKESAERNIKLNKAQEDAFKEIMLEQENTEFMSSENGFWYFYVTKVEGDSITADFGDILNFNYNIKDINGTVIYTEEELKTQNYAMEQQELFTGLREGLKLLKAGETATFFFPSNIAYGYYGDQNKIGTNVPLICTVTLNSIIQNKND